MAHGGYGDRRVSGRKPKPAGSGRRSKGPGVDNKGKAKKPKSVSLKNQIRSTERYLRKDLPPEVKDAQEKKLQDLKKEQETINRLAVERKIFLRDRKIKFFERRKIERAIRRLEKAQRASSGQSQESETSAELSKLKEDLEYVRFFPKTEKYVSLFIGGDDADIVDKRNKLRKQIKSNIIAAAASGKDLEETGSEDDGLLDISEDDFFLTKSSSDEEDADDEWTDKSTREQASSASGKATSGMSSDERNQRHISDRALMPPPRPSTKSFPNSAQFKPRFGGSSSKKQPFRRNEVSSSGTSYSTSESSFRNRQSLESSSFRNRQSSESSSFRNMQTSESSFGNRQSSESSMGHSSNLSSNSDAHKPKRKRRPKKKKAQA